MTRVTWDQVTNWRLGRGQLVSRVPPARMTKTVETMCGAHAQLASSVALSLAARVSGLKRKLVDATMEDDRTLVKTWAMRGTLHVFSADDLPLYCAAQRTRDPYNPAYLRYLGLDPSDVDGILDATRRRTRIAVLRAAGRPKRDLRPARRVARTMEGS